MNTRLKYPEIFQLSSEEKWELAHDLWEDVADSPPSLTVPQGILDELDRRREDLLQHPQTGQTWDEVKTELLSKYEPARDPTGR